MKVHGEASAIGEAGEAAVGGGRGEVVFEGFVIFCTIERPGPSADFSGGVVSAAGEMSILDDGDAEAAARADDDVIVEVFAGTEPTFCDGDGAEVIFEDDGGVELFAEELDDGNIAPVANKGVIEGDAFVWIDESGRADADAEERGFVRLIECFDGIGDGINGVFGGGVGGEEVEVFGEGIPGEIDLDGLDAFGGEFNAGEPAGIGTEGEGTFWSAQGALFAAGVIEEPGGDELVDVEAGGGGGDIEGLGERATGGGVAAPEVEEGLALERELICSFGAHGDKMLAKGGNVQLHFSKSN